MYESSRRVKHFWSLLPRRFREGMLVGVATVLIGWSAAWSQTAPPPPPRTTPSAMEATARTATGPAKQERFREGTELKEVSGYFRLIDGRVVFFTIGGDSRFTTLENLNLERIVSEITNNPTQLDWTVLGTVTEYRGGNYLLVKRAILSRSSSGSKAMNTQVAPPRPSRMPQ